MENNSIVNSRYRDVLIYAVMEHLIYERVDADGKPYEIAEPDHDPQLKYWNVYSDTYNIEVDLLVEDYKTIEDVKKFIDWRIENGV